MIYRIDKTILFRDDDGLIWNEGDDESQYDLTPTTSRLLAFLLQRRGEVLTRELILTQVWDNYGLRSSNNSLNKYIFDLRNVLSNLGCEDDVILTLPRVGFKISEALSIEIILKQEEGACTSDEEKSSETITLPPKKKITDHSMIFVKILIIFSLIAIFITLLSVAIKKNPVEQKTYSLISLDGCNVETFKYVPEEMVKTVTQIARKIIINNRVKCTTNSVVYLHLADSVLYGNGGKVFVSHCIFKAKSKNIYICHNNFEVIHEVKP